MAVNKIIRNDYGFVMTFTITDSDDAVVDLTGNTAIYFKMALPGATTCKVKGTCVSASPTTGVATYTVQSGDFDTIGIYNQEIEIQYALKVITASGEQISVVEDLPTS